MDDEKALPPLVVSGVPFLLNHRFAIVWPTGKVNSFLEWEELKVHMREQARNGNLDVVRAKVFICTKAWMEVPRPEA